MRAVIQRVTRASIRVADDVVGQIGPGLLVLLGIARDDSAADARYLVEKIVGLRIFDDSEGRMNLSLLEASGALLIVSQFTLYGDTRRGRRPSWTEAAAPDLAEPLYELFVNESRRLVPTVETGSFRRLMQVELVNDGPVTLLLESRKNF